MSKALASVVCGCMAALPLIGCAGDVTNARQAGAAPPAAGADVSTYYGGGPRVYAARPAAPTAIVVLLPAISAEGSQDVLARDPALWAAQGFDVVMPASRNLPVRLCCGAPTDLAGRCGSGY
jgi:hypothetical protein